jgi:hypothetical protein
MPIAPLYQSLRNKANGLVGYCGNTADRNQVFKNAFQPISSIFSKKVISFKVSTTLIMTINHSP